jgi:hypothetical protein
MSSLLQITKEDRRDEEEMAKKTDMVMEIVRDMERKGDGDS